jgi:type IV pilus assembly protein PilE
MSEPYPKRRQGMNKKGFTLLEMMMVVVVVGILAAIAIPSYTGYMNRTRRAEAITALETVALYEEKAFAETNSYETIGNLILNRGLPNPDTSNYTITVNALGTWAQGYVARATPKAGSPQAGDITFAIDSNGNRGELSGSTVTPNQQLWNSLRK